MMQEWQVIVVKHQNEQHTLFLFGSLASWYNGEGQIYIWLPH